MRIVKRNIVFALLIVGVAAGTSGASAALGAAQAPDDARVVIDAHTGTVTDARTGQALDLAPASNLGPTGDFLINARTGEITPR